MFFWVLSTRRKIVTENLSIFKRKKILYLKVKKPLKVRESKLFSKKPEILDLIYTTFVNFFLIYSKLQFYPKASINLYFLHRGGVGVQNVLLSLKFKEWLNIT